MQSGGGPLQPGPSVMRGLQSGTPANAQQQQPDLQKMQSQPSLMNQQPYQPQQNLFRGAGANQSTRPRPPMVPYHAGPIYATPMYHQQMHHRMPGQWANYGSIPGMYIPHHPQYYVQPTPTIMSGQLQQNRRNPAGDNNLVNVNIYAPPPPQPQQQQQHQQQQQPGKIRKFVAENDTQHLMKIPQVQLGQPPPNQQSSPMTAAHEQMLVMSQLHQSLPQQTPQQLGNSGQNPMDQHQPNPGQVNVGGPQQPPPHAMMPQLQLAHHLAAGAGGVPATKTNTRIKKRAHALAVIHPDTQENVLEDLYDKESSPPASSTSTPPTTGPPPVPSSGGPVVATGAQAIPTATVTSGAPPGPTSYSNLPPNVSQVPLNPAVESDYDNYAPHPHQATPELPGPAAIGMMHHQPPPHLHHPPPQTNHPPPHVHPGHPGAHPGAIPGQPAQIIMSHPPDMVRGGPPTVNAQQPHEIVYGGPGGAIKIMNPPPHLPQHHPGMMQPNEMTASGTPVVSAIADGPSVEIKPFQKKRKPPTDVQPPQQQHHHQQQQQQQQQQQHHQSDMHQQKPLPSNNSQQPHLHHHAQQQHQQLPPQQQHNTPVMNESLYTAGGPAERYRTISEKSIAESTLSTDAEPFIYTGPSSVVTSQQHVPVAVHGVVVEEVTPPIVQHQLPIVETQMAYVPLSETAVPPPQLTAAPAVEAREKSLSPTTTTTPAPIVTSTSVKSSSSNKALDSLVADVEKLSVEDNDSQQLQQIQQQQQQQHQVSNQTIAGHSNNKKKAHKKRSEDNISNNSVVASSETSSNISGNISSSGKAPAVASVVVEQTPVVVPAAAAVDETDRSVVLEQQQQQYPSAQLISNLVEHKLDNDNIINNNNVDCTSTSTITKTTDNTTENNSKASSPMENATRDSNSSRQQSFDSSRQHTPATTKLDVENNVQHQPEFDDNKNVVGVTAPALADTTTGKKQSTPDVAAEQPKDSTTEPKPAAPVIKKSRSITLIDYDPDQWSPDNPQGKKKYSREQLLQLKNTAPAREKPVMLPGVENLLIRSDHGGSNYSMGGGGGGGRNLSNFAEISILPGFMKDRMVGGGGNMGPMRQPYPAKRPSQQGNSGQPQPNKQSQQNMSKTGSKIIRLQLDEEVKLKECANAWRPRHLQTAENLDEVDSKTQELFKKFRSVLNKLTPENFEKLVMQVKTFVIDTDERLDGCIKLVFEKAISEPNFSEAYAKMCKEIGTIAIVMGNNEKKAVFKNRLLAQCQTEFERRRNDQTSAIRDGRAKLEANKGMAKAEFEELKAQLEEEELKVRRRAVGTVRFIGELFKHGQLTANIMHSCIQLLLDDKYDEETLECLCKLLTTIGQKMEKEHNQDLTKYITKMGEIVKNREQYKISSRIRFMIQDVIDLRLKGWQPRRQDLNPKTMNQIVKEQETEQMQINLNYMASRSGKDVGGGYSGDMGGRGNRGGSMQGGSKMSGSGGYSHGSLGRGGNQSSMKGGRMQTDDDGFQQISNNRNNRTVPIDLKKVNFPVPTNNFEMNKLGAAANYQGWNNNSNMYAALNSEDSSQGSMLNRDSDRDRDRGGDRRDRDRDRDRDRRDRDRDRDRDRSGSHNKNSGGKDSYHHKGSMERERYNRYGSSSSQNDDRMSSRSSREPSSGSMRPMSGQHSNSQIHDRDMNRDRNMGRMPSSQQQSSMPSGGRSSQQRHIPQGAPPPMSSSTTGRMGPPSSGFGGSALSKSGSGQLYPQQQMPQFVIPKDVARRNFSRPDKVTEDVILKFSKSVNIEMIQSDIEDSVELLKTISSDYYHAAISQLFEDNIERDVVSREKVVQVIAYMFEHKLITKYDYLHALEELFKSADDLIIDIPQLYKYMASFYVLLLNSKHISLQDIHSVAESVFSCTHGDMLLPELLQLYDSQYGKDATCMLWYESSMNFSAFIRKDRIEKCLNECRVGYLLDSGRKALDMDTVAKEIKYFLKSDAKFSEIFNWISQYVGPERVTSDEFIRTLIKAVLEHCIDSSKKLVVSEIQKWSRLLLKYIDNKAERELQAMFAIQRLVVELEHPQNLLYTILSELYEQDVIMEGFSLWKDSDDPLEQAGKGVCLKGIKQFLTMYMENLSEEDN